MVLHMLMDHSYDRKCSEVIKHMNTHDLLYDLQYGFREKRSCDTQLAMLVEDLARNLSAGKQTDLILLDFSKAFDKVNHSKLLWKLHQDGIRGNTLNWIRAFLSNRSQTVVLECEESGSVPVTSGVPLGSVLGPILFLVYINDSPDKLASKVRLFAEDTAVYLTIGGEDDSNMLQQDLDRLSVLESRWDMEFNPSKCQVVQVTTSRKLQIFHIYCMVMSWRLFRVRGTWGLTYPMACHGNPTLTV